MQVQINVAHSIEGHEKLSAYLSTRVETALRRVSDQINQLEVYLTDENGPKGGPDDKRCVMEAHLDGRAPITITHNAATINAAVDSAGDTLVDMIDRVVSQQRDRARQPSQRRD